MLQQDQPDDYVVATGETHSVREFAKLAFEYAGLDYEKHVVTDPQLYRPAEVDLLVGNPAKARTRLGWSSSVPLENLVWEMVESDCRAAGIRLSENAVCYASGCDCRRQFQGIVRSGSQSPAPRPATRVSHETLLRGPVAIQFRRIRRQLQDLVRQGDDIAAGEAMNNSDNSSKSGRSEHSTGRREATAKAPAALEDSVECTYGRTTRSESASSCNVCS